MRNNLEKLARVFVEHSLQIKKQEKVLITSDYEAVELVKAVYREVLRKGAYPLIDMSVDGLGYEFYKFADEWQMGYIPKEVVESKISWADAYVRIVAPKNLRELAQIDPKRIASRQKLMRPYMDKMIDGDRWVLTYYPTASMAQEAGVSLEWLTDFYFNSVLVDYKKMKDRLKKLEKIMDQGREMRVVGKDTDLRFSIKDRLACACYGERNIPDGEVFLAPQHKSLEGKIYLDLPSMMYGREVKGVRLEFKRGKVVNAQAEQGDEVLQKVLNTDRGVRYVGEFAVGANYSIEQAMKNTLFDEKIGGTIHMALGRAYKDRRGGGENESVIHWDLVKDMRSKGSRVEVDGRIILENGKLVV